VEDGDPRAEDISGVRDPPFLRNVGLLLTYHCQASCAHCIVRAGPNRHEEVRLEDVRCWIRGLAEYRDHHVYVLSLTGGEPFSNLELLRAVMEIAAECRLHVSVVTNGFWAVTSERARAILDSLPKIAFISISTDVYHQEYVPVERVQNAIGAFQDRGIPYYVSIVTDTESDARFQRTRAEILRSTAPENLRIGITFPVGRAARLAATLRYTLGEQPPKEACQAASSPCIFPDGRVFACIGPLLELEGDHPLLLGDLRTTPVGEVLDRAETNVVLHALRLWGPSRLVTMLREAGLAEHLPARYVTGSICNTCYALLSNGAIRAWLSRLQHDAEVRRKVAYGRLHYLDETGMLELGGA
jgi:organic radical activating enzyme